MGPHPAPPCPSPTFSWQGYRGVGPLFLEVKRKEKHIKSLVPHPPPSDSKKGIHRCTSVTLSVGAPHTTAPQLPLPSRHNDRGSVNDISTLSTLQSVYPYHTAVFTASHHVTMLSGWCMYICTGYMTIHIYAVRECITPRSPPSSVV